VVFLACWHGKTFPVPPSVPASARRFDAQKYFDELGFTDEHLARQFLGLPGSMPSQSKRIREFCEKIAQITPDTLQHRDFHTRNLVVHEKKLFVIDFQDARLGPPQYDLASLLYDAYLPVSEDERSELVATYRTELKSYEDLYEKIPWESFAEDLLCIAFQRVVKAAGSFASFYTRFGKETHLPYLLPALRSALELRQKSPRPLESLGDAIPLEAWIAQVEKRR